MKRLYHELVEALRIASEAKSRLNCAIYACSSVQEEVGGVGAWMYQALAGITGTDAELDAMVDGITDMAAVREHLRRLTRAVRTLVRQ
mgnify:CR=1 FL=1